MSVENCDYSEIIWTAEKILILVYILETVAHSHPKLEKQFLHMTANFNKILQDCIRIPYYKD
jgi:hypothetical protein